MNIYESLRIDDYSAMFLGQAMRLMTVRALGVVVVLAALLMPATAQQYQWSGGRHICTVDDSKNIWAPGESGLLEVSEPYTVPRVVEIEVQVCKDTDIGQEGWEGCQSPSETLVWIDAYPQKLWGIAGWQSRKVGSSGAGIYDAIGGSESLLLQENYDGDGTPKKGLFMYSSLSGYFVSPQVEVTVGTCIPARK